MPAKAKRNRLIKTYVTPEDYNAIQASAVKAGLSLSTFMKRVSLGQQVKSLEYTRERLKLHRIHGDLGRLGGLLKQALANGADKKQVYSLLGEIDLRQKEMKEAIRSVSHDSQAR